MLGGFVAEVEILSGDGEGAVGDGQDYLVGGFVGVDHDPFERLLEVGAGDEQFVGVVYGDDRVVVRVAGIDEAAGDLVFSEGEEGVGLVEGNGDLLIGRRQGTFEEVEGLLGDDEAGGYFAGDVAQAVLHEFVGVGSNHDEFAEVYLEEDAGHGRAELIGRSSEECFGDAFLQGEGGDADLVGIGGLGDIWVVFPVFAGELVGAVGGGDFDTVAFVINGEGDGLLGQGLQGVDEDFGGHGYRAVAVGIDFEGGRYAGFQVRSGDRELVALDDEEEVFEDGQYRVGADGTTGEGQFLL